VVTIAPICGSQTLGDAAAQREDLAAFRHDFLAVDQSYVTATRAEAERRLANLDALVGRISETRFALALAQIAALADNGHTRVVVRGAAAGGRVGIRLAPLGGEFFVLRATVDHADLLGGKLVSIDGVPVARLRDSAHTLTGGIASHRDILAPAFFESPAQLNAIGLTRSATQATYVFTTMDGSRHEATLTMVPDLATAVISPISVLDPAARRDGPSGWRTLLAPDKAPWSLQEFSRTMRCRDAPELDAAVMQLRANVDGQVPIATFLQSCDSTRRAAGRKNVVLDMRMNGGGNLQLTRDFMSSLPGRVATGGRVVVLMAPWTFSAAISSIGYLKQAGGDRVILVGEPPGDRLRFWAEGGPTTLPRSGALLLAATQRHDYLTGCKDFADCHGAVVRYPISVKTLDPDVAAPWTIDAYAAARDPGMEAAARVLGRR
jgi:hypothetical protein